MRFISQTLHAQQEHVTASPENLNTNHKRPTRSAASFLAQMSASRMNNPTKNSQTWTQTDIREAVRARRRCNRHFQQPRLTCQNKENIHSSDSCYNHKSSSQKAAAIDQQSFTWKKENGNSYDPSELQDKKTRSKILKAQKASKYLSKSSKLPQKWIQVFIRCVSFNKTQVCQVPLNCSNLMLYQLAFECFGIPHEVGKAYYLTLQGLPLPRTCAIIPGAHLKPGCTLQLYCAALKGGSSNAIKPGNNNNSAAQLLPSQDDDDIFFSSIKYENGFVKIDLPSDHEQEILANSCNAEQVLEELRTKKSISKTSNRLDFAKLDRSDLASITIAKHLLDPSEQRLLHNQSVVQQLKSKFDFDKLQERDKKHMSELKGLQLDQKSHGTYICRASVSNRLMRIESRDFSDFATIYQINEKSDQELRNERGSEEAEQQVHHDFKVSQGQKSEKKFFLTTYDFKESGQISKLHETPIPEPLSVGDMKNWYTDTPYLYVGWDDSVFFVTNVKSLPKAGSQSNKEAKSAEFLYLWIQEKDIENFQVTQIGCESQLHEFWKEGNQAHYVQSVAGAQPTTLDIEGRKQLAFSRFKFKEGPSVYMYDIQLKKEVRRFTGAQMLLRVISSDEKPSLSFYERQFYFYSDPGLCKEKIMDGEQMERLWPNYDQFSQGEDKAKEFYEENFAKDASSVMKKVVEQNFPYFDQEKPGDTKEIDLYEGLPPIDRNKLGSSQIQVKSIITKGQPHYRWCWFEKAQNVVMQSQSSNDHYFAIVSNQNYCQKMLLYRMQESDDSVTCIDHSYANQRHAFFRNRNAVLLKSQIDQSDHKKPTFSVKSYSRLDEKHELQIVQMPQLSQQSNLEQFIFNHIAPLQLYATQCLESTKYRQNITHDLVLKLQAEQTIEKLESEESIDKRKKQSKIEEELKQFTDHLAESSFPTWSMTCNFPLLGVINENAPDRVILGCLADQLQHQVSIDISKFGEAFAFVKDLSQTDQACISLLVYRKGERELCLMTIKLDKGFSNRALLLRENIKISVRKLRLRTRLLVDNKHRIKSLFINKNEDQKEFLVCSTDSEIFFQNEKILGSRNIVCEDNSEKRLGEVSVVQIGPRDFYFATEDNNSYLNHFVADFDSLDVKSNIAYSFNSENIKAIQQCRSNQSAFANTYNYEGNEASDNYGRRLAQLIVLDKDYVFHVVQQTSDGKFSETKSIDLSRHQIVKNLVDRLKPFEMVSISDRTITSRGRFVNINSGRDYSLLEDSDYQDYEQQLQSLPVPNSDVILQTLEDRNEQKITLVAINDPGTRRLNTIGQLGFSQTKNVVTISEESLLFQLKEVYQRDTKNRKVKERLYWTQVQYGDIVKINHTLQKLLDDREWKHVIGCTIMNNLTQIVFYFVPPKKYYSGQDRNDNRNDLKHLNYEKHIAKIVLLSPSGEVLKDHLIRLNGGSLENITNEELLMNYQGDLVQIQTINGKKAKDDQVEEGGSTVMVRVNKNFDYVKINSQHQYELVYAGDYICYRQLDDSDFTINFFRLNRSKRVDSEYFIVPNRLSLREHMKVLTGWCNINISACSPHQMMRTSVKCSLEQQTLKKHANHLQVTADNLTQIFNLEQAQMSARKNKLNPEKPNQITLVKQVGDIDELSHPEKYVELGFTVTQSENSYWGVTTTLVPNTWGTLILIKQKQIRPLHHCNKEDQEYAPITDIYKQYCKLDIKSMSDMRQEIRDSGKFKELEFQVMLTLFGNETIFKEFGQKNDFQLLDAIGNAIEDSKHDQKDLRSLAHILQLRTDVIEEPVSKKVPHQKINKLKSYLQQVSITTPELRDLILKIGRHSKDFTIFDTFDSQGDFKQLLKKMTFQSQQEMMHCLQETFSTKQIESINWPSALEILTIRSHSCKITKEMIKDKFDSDTKKYKNRAYRKVEITALDMEFFYENKQDYNTFVQALVGLPQNTYSSPLIEGLLDQLWISFQSQILYQLCIPSFALSIMSIFSFIYSLKEEGESERSDSASLGLRIGLALPIFALWVYQIMIEVRQLKDSGVIKYLSSAQNWVDVTGLSLTIVVVAASSPIEPLIPIEDLRLMAAVASAFVILKLFDWLRLFENTAFYVLLLKQTLSDIKIFIVLIFVALATFGIPMTILNFNREEENQVVDGLFSFWFLNMFINQYLLALGEFSIDNFANNPQSIMCYFFFICATFITQITMFNMLIAIMGDTFEQITENKALNSTKSRLELMGDLQANLMTKNGKGQDNGRFLFLIKPRETQITADDQWQGSLKQMTNMTRSLISSLEKNLNSKGDKLQKTMDEFKDYEVKQDKASKEYNDRQQKESVAKLTQMITDQGTALEKKITKQGDEIKELIKSLLDQKQK